MGKLDLGKVVRLPDKIAESLNDVVKKAFIEKGIFSGTDECKCGGKVEYSLKRNDGAEIGICIKCSEIYIDYKGNRFPSIFNSKIRYKENYETTPLRIPL